MLLWCMLWETFYHVVVGSPLQSEVLECMQLEYKDSKEKLASLQDDTEKQLQDIQERRRSLQDQEAELKAEEERLSQLRTANSKETEELLKRQKSELKDAIEWEKKALKSLKEYVHSCKNNYIMYVVCFRSRITVESEVQQLSHRKMTLELCVEQLGLEELRHRESMAQHTTGEDRQHSEASEHRPMHTTADAGAVASSVRPREERDGGMGGTGGSKMEESWEEQEGETDTAMDILDLEPAVSKVLAFK